MYTEPMLLVMFPVAAVVALEPPVSSRECVKASPAPKARVLPFSMTTFGPVNEPPPSFRVPVPPFWPMMRLKPKFSVLPPRLSVPDVPLPLPRSTTLADSSAVRVTVAIDAAPLGYVLAM